MSIVPQLVLNSIISGSIYTLVALGFTLIFNSSRFFNLAHGTVAAIGGYAVFFFAQRLGLNVYLAIVIALLICGIVGWLSDEFVFKPLRQKKASNMIQLVASLGVFTVLQALLAILFTSQFQTLSKLMPDQKVYLLYGGAITQVQVLMFVCAVLVFALLSIILKKTKFGHAVMAISDDEEVAKIVGINTDKIIGLVFFIGSAIAGLAGILIGFDTGLQPTMGLPILLSAITGMIIGGIGSMRGVLLGCFLLAFVENFGIWHIDGEWKSAISFGLLIIFLLFRPQGLIKK